MDPQHSDLPLPTPPTAEPIQSVAKTKKVAVGGIVQGSWEATAGERVRFIAFVVMFVLAYSIDLISPWAIGYILGAFVQFGVSPQAVNQAMWGLAAFIGLKLAYLILHHSGRYLQAHVAYAARMYTAQKVFDTLLRFPLKWHVSNHAGETLSRLHRAAGAVDGMVGTYVWQIIEGLVKVVFAGVAIFALDFWVAVNVIVLSLITIGAMIGFHQKLIPRLRDNNRFGDQLNRIWVDFLTNIVTVKTLGLEAPAKRYVKDRYGEGLALTRGISRYMEMKWGATNMGYSFVIASSLVIYFARHRSQPGPLDVAQVYVLLNYLDRIYQAIGGFTAYYSAVMEAATAYEDAENIYSAAGDLPAPPSKSFPTWDSIAISGLSYRYAQGEKPGLTDVAVELRKGERIGLVGPSGSGKTTFLRILGGMITPDAISITLCSPGHAVPLPMDALNAVALLVPQEPEVFSESLRYNLTMGEDYDEEQVLKAANACAVSPIINRLPRGLDSDLAQKGLNVSGGERQRIALARGVLRADVKEILLLDEPTSSLDPRTEQAVFEQLLQAFPRQTVIASVHRLNLLSFFDRVIVMKDGQIVEQGTFKDLLASGQEFAKMWNEYQEKMKM